jgi:hypothetical protein
MNTPKWAQDLILDAILYIQSTTHLTPELPDIHWRHPTNGSKYFPKRRAGSSGVCYRTHITICGGSNRIDCKLVILHELAHWARPWGEHHSSDFWDLCWQLYREYKLPIRYCKQREVEYRKGALAAYHRNRNKLSAP